MIAHLNKLIHSSIFVTFLAFLCWGTAYTYGWGTALAYGYPWWHIEVGASNIATSLAYVLVMTAVLVIGYIIGFYVMHQAAKRHAALLGSLRIFTILSILFFTSWVGIYIFIGRPPLYFFLPYLGLAITLPCLLNRVGMLFSLDYRRFKNPDSAILVLMIFLAVYFLSFAFIIGMIRPYINTNYAVLNYAGKPHYILKVNNNDYILAEKPIGSRSFIFLNRTTLKGYQIHMIDASTP